MMGTAKGTSLYVQRNDLGPPLTRPLGGHLQAHVLLPQLPSYLHDWRSLDDTNPYEYGVLARRDPLQHPIFNIPQKIWLAPDITMDWGSQYTEAVQTLAINVLAFFCKNTNGLPHTDPLLKEFAELFLLSAPDDAWRIPLSTLADWCEEFL